MRIITSLVIAQDRLSCCIATITGVMQDQRVPTIISAAVGGEGILVVGDEAAQFGTVERRAAGTDLAAGDLLAQAQALDPGAEIIGVERNADVLRLARDHLELDRVVCCGHSFGGLVAQELALRYPERARKLLLDRVKEEIGPDVDMRHFTPKYGPWEQRLCAVPDGDFFEALRAGRLSMATDHIDHFFCHVLFH